MAHPLAAMMSMSGTPDSRERVAKVRRKLCGVMKSSQHFIAEQIVPTPPSDGALM